MTVGSDGSTPPTMAEMDRPRLAPRPTRSTTGSRGLALLRAARPRQWTKNLLVFAAPAASGELLKPDVLLGAVMAFVAFCLAASGTYYLNDVVDADADRLHPRKRHRPIASGIISAPVGVGIGAVLLLASMAVAALTGVALALVVALYVCLTVSYSLALKRLPIVDIIVVASGFLIRAVAGGVATAIPLSQWFLLVASFGALFIVTGKRHAEVETMGAERGAHRAVLEAYSPELTRHILTLGSGLTLISYCLWAFEQGVEASNAMYTLSILPFLGVMLRYAMLVLSGHGGEPEEILFSDRALQLVVFAWVVLLGLAIVLV